MRFVRWSSPVVLAFGLWGCGEPTASCDLASTQAALDSAAAGDTVTVGACRLEGRLVIPSGVTLAGAGPDLTTLVASDPARAAVRLRGGDGTVDTTLRGIAIEGEYAVGVYADEGDVLVEDVSIEARVGVGLVFHGAREVTVRRVSARGPVPAGGGDRPESVFSRVAPSVPAGIVPLDPSECAGGPAPTCTPGAEQDAACELCGGSVAQFCDGCGRWTSVLATQGLALDTVAAATLEDVSVRGFSEVGVVLRDSSVTWTRGDADENLGLGLWMSGGSSDLTGVSLSRTAQPLRVTGTYSAYVTASLAGAPSFISSALVLDASAGFGLAQVEGTAHHDGLRASGNVNGAVWLGRLDDLELTDAVIRDNGFVGLAIVNPASATLSGVRIRETRMRSTFVRFGETAMLGDGIQLFGSLDAVSLTDVSLEANERVGLSVDLADATADLDICRGGAGLCFTDVTVDAMPGARGALAGGMRAMRSGSMTTYTTQLVGSGTWDVGITRTGAATDDATATGPLDLVGVVAPIDSVSPLGVVAPID